MLTNKWDTCFVNLQCEKQCYSSWLINTHLFCNKVFIEANYSCKLGKHGLQQRKLTALTTAPSTHRLAHFKNASHSTLRHSLSRLHPPESDDDVLLALFVLPFLQTSFTFQFICFGIDVSLVLWFSIWLSPPRCLSHNSAHSHVYPSHQNPSPTVIPIVLSWRGFRK